MQYSTRGERGGTARDDAPALGNRLGRRARDESERVRNLTCLFCILLERKTLQHRTPGGRPNYERKYQAVLVGAQDYGCGDYRRLPET